MFAGRLLSSKTRPFFCRTVISVLRRTNHETSVVRLTDHAVGVQSCRPTASFATPSSHRSFGDATRPLADQNSDDDDDDDDEYDLVSITPWWRSDLDEEDQRIDVLRSALRYSPPRNDVFDDEDDDYDEDEDEATGDGRHHIFLSAGTSACRGLPDVLEVRSDEFDPEAARERTDERFHELLRQQLTRQRRLKEQQRLDRKWRAEALRNEQRARRVRREVLARREHALRLEEHHRLTEEKRKLARERQQSLLREQKERKEERKRAARERHEALLREQRRKREERKANATITTDNNDGGNISNVNSNAPSSVAALQWLVDAGRLPGPIVWEINDASDEAPETISLTVGGSDSENQHRYEAVRTDNVKRKRLQRELAERLLIELIGEDWDRLSVRELRERIGGAHAGATETIAQGEKDRCRANEEDNVDFEDDDGTTTTTDNNENNNVNSDAPSPVAALHLLVDAGRLPGPIVWEIDDASDDTNETISLTVGGGDDGKNQHRYEVVRTGDVKRKRMRQELAGQMLIELIGKDWDRLSVRELRERIGDGHVGAAQTEKDHHRVDEEENSDGQQLLHN